MDNKNEGFASTSPVPSLLITNNFIFAGTGEQVWRRSLSEFLGIQNVNPQIPESFSLSQNYPNPFNPSTTIRYSLPSSANVKLTVYDLLGREITTLVNEEHSEGWKEVEWNASQYSSGMYLYRIESGNFVSTKKLILLR